MKVNKAFIIIPVFIAVWILCLFLSLVITIIFAFMMRDNPNMDLEMGWMAVIILLPPLMSTCLSIWPAIFISNKISAYLNKRKSGC